ncbi:MAG: lysine--tRNA ligase [Patescibacteria group bacterium]|nr:lysine--tRNA ligase [Patescibacteria group bacterium]
MKKSKDLDQYRFRLEKLEKLKEKKINAFPAQAERTHTIKQALAKFEKLAKNNKEVTILGRLKSLRLHGGSLFCDLEDASDSIQIYLKKNKLGPEKYNLFKNNFDIGDFIQITGLLFKTKRGEETVLVHDYKLLTKALMPLPEKWHGLSDTEVRFRQRYLDLIANPEVKAIFEKRSLIVRAIREFLDRRGFLEVETPVLQSIPGGANAKPFKTHHKALDIDLYLRIAPELFLKRLIIGGFEKVYEIARCFRNEGIDHSHNPEFTQVEFYWAYADYEDLMQLTEQMIGHILDSLKIGPKIKYENRTIDFKAPFKRISFNQALKKYVAIDLDKIKNDKELIKKAKNKGLEIEKNEQRGSIIDNLFKKLIRPNLINPTFVIDYPTEISPLSKKKATQPNYTERFQLIAGGQELTNAFSELNDPLDQKERFMAQESLRKKGDQEAQRIDESFIEALTYGMPPTAGFGLGIDRLTALLTNRHNIKEVILFPTLKPKK